MIHKISVFSCLLAAFFIVVFDGPCNAEFKKTKIAVLDFELKGETFKTKDMGGIVAEWFTTALVQDGRFQVVERALLKKIIDEQKLGMTGLIDEGSSAQIGKILGVRTIISGSVLQLTDAIEVNARIINVSTGSIVAAENLRSKDTSGNLKELIERLTAKIVKNFPLTGYVVKKRNDTVLIDLGTTSSVQVGMEFIVYKEGAAIKHPKTGEVLEVEQIRTGLIKISEIGTNTFTAEIIQEEPKQEIRYGQLVQSIRENKPVSEPSPPKEKPESAKSQDEFIAAMEKSKEKGIDDKKEPEKPASPKAETGYVRAEFSPGERDNLAAGGQGPTVLPLPTGTFLMGSDRFSEKPQHFVKIDKPVFLTVAEVTFEDYEKFCLETGAAFPDDSGWGGKDRPVVNVSWHDAQAYAAWLTKQTGTTYRLPSETEWEWAAGAGTGTLYAWGNAFKQDMANCKTCSLGGFKAQTLPTRSFPANKFGFHDMSGNVWEWVQDCWVENYINASEDQSPRKFTGKCSNYTVRGGAWNSPERQISTTARLGVLAETKSNYIGFRLVKDPAAPPSQDTSSKDAGLPVTLPPSSGSKATGKPQIQPAVPPPPASQNLSDDKYR